MKLLFLGKLYLRVLSVNEFVKIIDFVFVYSGESIVNVAYPKKYSSA